MLYIVLRLYRALDIRINAYGEDHHEVGQTLLSYSAFLIQNDPLAAADTASRAAKIYEVGRNSRRQFSE